MTAPPEVPRRTGPVVIGYDGTPVAERALAEAACLLASRPALVVVVWEAGRAFEAATWSAMTLDVPVPTVDLRTAFELDQAAYEAAERMARQGAGRARAMGLEAESLVVADEVSVADTLVRVAREQDAPALAIGAHAHGALSEVLLGSTSRDVLRHAPCPVLVVREPAGRGRRHGS
ncbi:universal stress protein [Geodermatophilus ruber]|uniref:universal stress protein n=1 Tax=Geodermatophilus ruber TaxID=504800 RepID=UPI000B8842B1